MMAHSNKNKLNRREFLKQSTVAAAAMSTGMGLSTAHAVRKGTIAVAKKKVIVIGIDGMDPRLSEEMMNAGLLPNFNRLRGQGGYSRLGTSIPPQSPVAWANFITGANPGRHGIFSFVRRDPENQCEITDAMSHSKAGIGLPLGKYVLMLRQPENVLARQGVPFWDYLDEIGVQSAVYLAPSNYPPSQSKHGHHRSLSGMGTPDLMGSLATYQYFSEDGPAQPKEERGGIHCRAVIKNETAETELLGPPNLFLRTRKRSAIKFSIHRDLEARAAVIEIQGQKIVLKEGQWSDWVELDFALHTPMLILDKHVHGICRFLLQKIAPTFRLYVSPISNSPAHPAMKISEPHNFVVELAKELGPFYTVGFQEEFKARNNNVFTDEEYAGQAEMVLQTRLKLLDRALECYTDGLLFFYFSSTDLQSHMFWWDTDKKNPVRSRGQAVRYHNRIKELYVRMDGILGDILNRYAGEATIIVLSDHGFSYFNRSFDLNTWLRNNGYIRPSHCTAMCPQPGTSETGIDWSATRAYCVGWNGLYLNLRGRERDGIVGPEQREALLRELVFKLESVRDVDGSPVIRRVYRADKVYSGPAMKYAPDLILGSCRGYKAAGLIGKGNISPVELSDNTDAWSADHCFAAEEVPGVLFSNRSIRAKSPSLVDLAPTILAEFGLSRPPTMEGSNVFAS
jgi:predicted AlkP superfamily phosphohydrolase/phosphomutase